MTFRLTPPDTGKPPSLATDDRFMIIRCECGTYYRHEGFPLAQYQHVAGLAYEGQARYIGHNPRGTCEECR